MTPSELEAEIKNLNEEVDEVGQNLRLAESILATRREVHTVGVQVASIREDLTRVAGQVARLHTLLSRLVPGDGRKRHL